MRKQLLLQVALGLILACASVLAADEPNISGQQKAAMINAARTDVIAQLAREIKGLNVSASTVVANAVTAEQASEALVKALVKGAVIGEPLFVGDVCLIEGRITLDQIVENLTQLSASDNGKTTQFEAIKRYNTNSIVLAVGSGTITAPSGSVLPSPASDLGLAEALRAMKGPGQPKLGAVEAARIDAYTQFAAQLKGINVADQSTIFNFVSDRWTEATTQALVKGARVKRYFAMADDLVACEMEITLQQVVENIQKSSTLFSNGKEITTEKIRRHNPALVTVKATGYGALPTPGAAVRPISSAVIPGSVQ